jgi:hypothetical protein
MKIEFMKLPEVGVDVAVCSVVINGQDYINIQPINPNDTVAKVVEDMLRDLDYIHRYVFETGLGLPSITQELYP